MTVSCIEKLFAVQYCYSIPNHDVEQTVLIVVEPFLVSKYYCLR